MWKQYIMTLKLLKCFVMELMTPSKAVCAQSLVCPRFLGRKVGNSAAALAMWNTTINEPIFNNFARLVQWWHMVGVVVLKWQRHIVMRAICCHDNSFHKIGYTLTSRQAEVIWLRCWASLWRAAQSTRRRSWRAEWWRLQRKQRPCTVSVAHSGASAPDLAQVVQIASSWWPRRRRKNLSPLW